MTAGAAPVPARGARAPRPGRRRALVALLCAGGLAVAGCGGDDGASAPPVSGAGPNGLDARAMSTYDCDDWKAADADGRLAALEALHHLVGGPIVGEDANGSGRVLAEEDGYRLLDRICKPDYAAGFLLYKVYGRSAGFAGVAP
ncbi:hypothetical protein SK069_06760 [Patulibacter brassicae]|uniref:DUF732 domain-containing protein n=1 Tax=Patulibacter brassicae TaxID=1705717 RepID=A0ABU4VHJ5_9ACTN|nr:hypothetical protein [Patulibacter brassicae]MDX8151284.1 hypothetical protein [Patulibacter brassicae]